MEVYRVREGNGDRQGREKKKKASGSFQKKTNK